MRMHFVEKKIIRADSFCISMDIDGVAAHLIDSSSIQVGMKAWKNYLIILPHIGDMSLSLIGIPLYENCKATKCHKVSSI